MPVIDKNAEVSDLWLGDNFAINHRDIDNVISIHYPRYYVLRTFLSLKRVFGRFGLNHMEFHHPERRYLRISRGDIYNIECSLQELGEFCDLPASFDWSMTPEGHDHWKKLNDDYRELLEHLQGGR